jgi:hypothetical protein
MEVFMVVGESEEARFPPGSYPILSLRLREQP